MVPPSLTGCENFEALGWTISGFETVPFQSVTDWRGLLAKIRENPPDIVIDTNSVAEQCGVSNQFMEDPTDSLVFLQYGPSVPEFIQLTEENSTGVLYNFLGGAIDSLPDEGIRDKTRRAVRTAATCRRGLQ